MHYRVPMQTKQCARCRGLLEEGFLADKSAGGVTPALWVQGLPQSTFRTGRGGAAVAGKTQRLVQSFRCTDCGHLESFATAEWPTP